MSRFVSKLIILKKNVELRQDNYGGELSLLEDKLGVDFFKFYRKQNSCTSTRWLWLIF